MIGCPSLLYKDLLDLLLPLKPFLLLCSLVSLLIIQYCHENLQIKFL